MSVPFTKAAPDHEAVATRRDPPLVSVIVPTRNRAGLLHAGIAGVLAGCADVDAEVIYVDDSSTDDTSAVLAEYALTGKIQHVRARSGAPGRARNAGAAIAKGRYLLFTDDDCLVPPGWVAGMLNARERRGVTALTGGFRPASMKTPAERYYEYRMRLLFADKPKLVPAAPMMNLLVERSAFEEVGGFSDLRLPAMEDWELCYRLGRAGHPLFYDPSVSVVHAYGHGWQYVVKRVSQAAWLAPAIWRISGLNPWRKLARDAARFLGAPLWCLRYFPPRLYPVAVALELAYFPLRIIGVFAARIVEHRLRTRRR
jgi:glycosyltransferase involved in cell wall biosynthesis